MRVEKSYTRCMQHGKSHKIYRRHEPSFNNFIQHGKSYTIYVRQEKSYEFCFQRGNQTQFPLKHDFFKKFCSTPSRIFLAPEKNLFSKQCLHHVSNNIWVTGWWFLICWFRQKGWFLIEFKYNRIPYKYLSKKIWYYDSKCSSYGDNKSKGYHNSRYKYRFKSEI